MFLVVKYEEIWVFEVNDFVYILDNVYMCDEVLIMEKNMFNILKFNFMVFIFYVFIVWLLKVVVFDKQEKMVLLMLEMVFWFLVEFCFMEYFMIKYVFFLLVVVVVYIVQIIFVREFCWGFVL